MAASESQTSLPRTYEEERQSHARVQELLAASSFAEALEQCAAQLVQADSALAAAALVAEHGRALFRTAVAKAAASDRDDRPLYWARLQHTAYLRADYKPRFELSLREREALITSLERASRGVAELAFPARRDALRIVVSGFDPFRLEQAVGRSNPSGAAALSLHGRQVTDGSLRAELRAVLFPVRFRDFDRGLVEETFAPLLQQEPGVDMIMTMSQNSVAGFTIERWAGRRRSLELSDNLAEYGDLATTPGSGQSVLVGVASAYDREFEQTGLPVEAMMQAAPQLAADPLQVNHGRSPLGPGAAVRGSGGNYLSNEIFYRTSSLERTLRAEQQRARVPVGHLHLPLMEAALAETDPSSYARRRREIADRVELIVRAALPGLLSTPLCARDASGPLTQGRPK